MVDFHGFRVGKYTSPMDPMGFTHCLDASHLPEVSPHGRASTKNDIITETKSGFSLGFQVIDPTVLGCPAGSDRN